jgi:hypothetical protein
MGFWSKIKLKRLWQSQIGTPSAQYKTDNREDFPIIQAAFPVVNWDATNLRFDWQSQMASGAGYVSNVVTMSRSVAGNASNTVPTGGTYSGAVLASAIFTNGTAGALVISLTIGGIPYTVPESVAAGATECLFTGMSSGAGLAMNPADSYEYNNGTAADTIQETWILYR